MTVPFRIGVLQLSMEPLEETVRMAKACDAAGFDTFWLAEAYRLLGPRSQQLTEKELTNSAKKDAARKREKRTVEEEERELLTTPAGQENAKAHQQKADELYRRALSLDNPTPLAHRGLGMLYEKLGRKSDALSEYQKYIELAPAAIDRERIQKRIEALTKE